MENIKLFISCVLFSVIIVGNIGHAHKKINRDYFIPTTEKVDYREALSNCYSHNMSLLQIRNEEEFNHFMNNSPHNEGHPYWLGLKRKDSLLSYTWITDRSNFNYMSRWGSTIEYMMAHSYATCALIDQVSLNYKIHIQYCHNKWYNMCYQDNDDQNNNLEGQDISSEML